MAAELWSAVPQAAAPREVEQPTPPPVARKVEPVAPPPKVETPPAPDPQIAIEKARREEAKRVKAERDEEEREQQRIQNEQVQKKAAADKLKAEKERAERDKAAKNAKAEETQLAALRDDNLKRILGQAGATGGPTDTGTAARSSGPSASYAGRIMARIKPNIVFTDPVDGNPLATVEVKLAPDGTIVAKRLVKSSGVRSWDDAVLRAIDRTEVLPRDIDGRVPPPFQIDFRLRD